MLVSVSVSVIMKHFPPIPDLYVVLRLKVPESGGDTREPDVDETGDNSEVPQAADQAQQDVVSYKELPEQEF